MSQSSFIKFAVFNVALSFQRPGQLIQQLATQSHRQTQNIAEIIQRVQPDVLALLEFDYDNSAEALRLFQSHYLSVSQQGAPPILFKYFYVFPSNTGIPSGFDLNRDGKTTGADDALGFGLFPGQYAFALLSKYPIYGQKFGNFKHFYGVICLSHIYPSSPLLNNLGIPRRCWIVYAYLLKIMWMSLFNLPTALFIL